MNVVAIIQARMGSTRLPGKVLRDVAGETMLARVVRRIQLARTLDTVVVATTVAPSDNAIVAECERLGVAVFRGSEQDVLDRYRQAACAHHADVTVRITSDLSADRSSSDGPCRGRLSGGATRLRQQRAGAHLPTRPGHGGDDAGDPGTDLARG